MMKITLKNIEKYFSPTEIETIDQFIQFLQSQIPLIKDVHISFDGERNGAMTTGVRLPKHNIRILSKDRLLIDILRTVAHEWVHEYQHQKMGLKDTTKIQDIGGPEENMANVLSGIYIKKFAKMFPNHKHVMFGEQDE